MAILSILGCSSSKVIHHDNAALDKAIALYIDADYEQAKARLNKLTKELNNDEELRTAYLYLGRSHMATEDYILAAEAFSLGRTYGHDVRFDEYLAQAQQFLAVSPKLIRMEPRVTRGQLAALIDKMFAARIEGTNLQGTAAMPDVEDHWSRRYALAVTEAGIMEPLPDGGFHPDAHVTTAAFTVTLYRLADALSLDRARVEGSVPGGLRTAIEKAQSNSTDAWVSGTNVIDVLETLSNEAGS